MRLIAFRIRNFRSIVDTGYVTLSEDGITAMIGQNEAGKTNVLDALAAYGDGQMLLNDQRSDGSMPEVACCFSVSDSPSKLLSELVLPSGFDAAVEQRHRRIAIERRWSSFDPIGSEIHLDSDLEDMFASTAAASGGGETPASLQEVTHALLDLRPEIVLFDEKHSLLPDEMDFVELQIPSSSVEGAKAVRNFMEVAELAIDEINSSDNPRVVDKKLDNASRRITGMFQNFWSQTIGGSSKVSLACEKKFHDDRSGKPGLPYLEFLVKDNRESLHLAQRSKGMQWFVSFYLQLAASAKSGSGEVVFLIDEPGAALHAKAQQNEQSLSPASATEPLRIASSSALV